MEANQGRLAQQMIRENGKLLREAAHEISVSVSELRYYAGLARNIFGRATELEPGLHAWLAHEPLGVAGIIVPWNAPCTLLIRSLAPALAAGCTCVVKSAIQTSLFTNAIFELMDGIEGLAPGVVNFVSGDLEVARALVSSDDVAVLSYTGSTAVGKRIMADASGTLKRLNLELGGSAPCLVMADANIDETADAIAKAVFAHAGQVCMAASRILVHEDIAKQFEEALCERFRAVRLGLMDDPDASMGPLINQASVDRVMSLAKAAARFGEILVQGGEGAGELSSGSFLSPTLLRVNDCGAPSMTEEVFGPLASVLSFKSPGEAISLANSSRFGLCGSVWSGDLDLALACAKQMECGTVWVNQHMRTHAEIEAGGYKESGIGRLHGVEGMLEFMQTKHISYRITAAKS
jgi:acyl-CoA reductase-like NAD-dependent aldehyde dehydrogenase